MQAETNSKKVKDGTSAISQNLSPLTAAKSADGLVATGPRVQFISKPCFFIQAGRVSVEPAI